MMFGNQDSGQNYAGNNRWRLAISLIFLLALLNACAGSPPAASRTEVQPPATAGIDELAQAMEIQTSQQHLLTDVSYPLQEAAIPFCQDFTRPVLGFVYKNKYAFPRQYQDAAATLFGVGEHLQVFHVIAESAAGRAGLQKGDLLVAMNGEFLPASGEAAMFGASEIISRNLRPGMPMTINVIRDGRKHEIVMTPVELCDSPVMLDASDTINAGTDGRRIVVTRGMLDFVRDNQELSLVIAHELALNLLQRQDARARNFLPGTPPDLAGENGPTAEAAPVVDPRALVAKADYMGLAILALAGIQFDNAAAFWQRLAEQQPVGKGQDVFSSHPLTPERFEVVENAVREIKRRQAAGEMLLPDAVH